MDDQSLMREWASGPFRLELHEASHRHFGGPTPIGYRLYYDGRLIFEGDDIAVPEGESLDGDQTVRAVLNFLSQQPGDVEPDYFARYTPAQLAWRDRHANDLELLLDEWPSQPPS
jgi:hypothetical protein